MIQQTSTGLNSRKMANPYDKYGFLPLITAPMYSVVNNENYQFFLDNRIQACLPRNHGKIKTSFTTSYPLYLSFSLQEFINEYLVQKPYYEGNIVPDNNTIFVFESNLEGRHDADTAKEAVEKFEAQYGIGEGLTGNAYALPTKDFRVKENNGLKSISQTNIIESINLLYNTAKKHPDKLFKVAYRNTSETSLSGYTGYEMMNMFLSSKSIPSNIIFSEEWYFSRQDDFLTKLIIFPYRVCIDTANGNMPELHRVISEAKNIYKRKIIIMAGNVASTDAFVKLAITGVDYIRVGVGGGAGCNTTANTGIGQKNLEHLIKSCKKFKDNLYSIDNYYDTTSQLTDKERCNIKECKIVADGISSYIKYCENKYGFNDNGYAAINKLLFAGADLVMIGKLFAQCIESAGEKAYIKKRGSLKKFIPLSQGKSPYAEEPMYVKYSGMSTQKEQIKYKISDIKAVEKRLSQCNETGEINENTHKAAQAFINLEKMAKLKPSEGSVQHIPVRWSLKEWLHGSEFQDEYPYLMGWVNSIKSAMAYTNKLSLNVG